MEVTLREFTEADAEALLSWASDTRVVLFQCHEVYARVDEARRYIRETGTTSCHTNGTAPSASAARLWAPSTSSPTAPRR
jgi:RimJ/RimL family protein N-acetyltransferase